MNASSYMRRLSRGERILAGELREFCNAGHPPVSEPVELINYGVLTSVLRTIESVPDDYWVQLAPGSAAMAAAKELAGDA